MFVCYVDEKNRISEKGMNGGSGGDGEKEVLWLSFSTYSKYIFFINFISSIEIEIPLFTQSSPPLKTFLDFYI